MVDRIDRARRSANMARIGPKNTAPEIAVRRAAHAAGYRFRLHRRDLPGCPDLVFPRYGLAVFVHGCFWHRHQGCRYAAEPKTRPDFWQAKFAANIERDKRVQQALRTLGWSVEIIWECETTDVDALTKRLQNRFFQRRN